MSYFIAYFVVNYTQEKGSTQLGYRVNLVLAWNGCNYTTFGGGDDP